jgi:hypothetical protein
MMASWLRPVVLSLGVAGALSAASGALAQAAFVDPCDALLPLALEPQRILEMRGRPFTGPDPGAWWSNVHPDCIVTDTAGERATVLRFECMHPQPDRETALALIAVVMQSFERCRTSFPPPFREMTPESPDGAQRYSAMSVGEKPHEYITVSLSASEVRGGWFVTLSVDDVVQPALTAVLNAAGIYPARRAE